MTDKVQKIREEVERLQIELFQEKEKGYGSDVDDACILELQNILTYIDSLQEEPESEDLEAELDKYIKDNFTIDKEQLDRFGIEEKDYMYSMDKSDMEKMVRYFTCNYKIPVSDDLEEAAKLYVSDSLCITGEEDWDDAALEALNAYKTGAKWQKAKYESISDDLGEYINELSKQFPEVSFAKLSRIAVRVAKWQIEQIKEVLLSEVLPCFMHGGEADEVVAKLDEVLNQKK